MDRIGPRPGNISGDPAGYNIKLFPTPRSVREALVSLGYPIAVNDSPITSDARVGSFQTDWNRVVAGQAAGKLEIPWNLAPSLVLKGTLAKDDVPGVNTLRALEIALRLKLGGQRWSMLVAQSLLPFSAAGGR